MTMASNYNARLRPAEYWVSGADVEKIRRQDTLDDLLRVYEV